MDMQNQAVNRTVFFAIGVLALCATWLGTASAQAANTPPQGYILATLRYIPAECNRLIGHCSLFTTPQAAASIFEQKIQSEDAAFNALNPDLTFTDTFSSTQGCPTPETNQLFYDGAPHMWCAVDTTVETFNCYYCIPPSTDSTTSTLNQFVAETVPVCPPGDGVAGSFNIGSWTGYTDVNGIEYDKPTCKVTPQLVASITPSPIHPLIPAYSGVKAGKVLTRDYLLVNMAHGPGGSPAPGIHVLLQSSRGSDDDITQPPYPTDQDGQTAGIVETRDNGDGTMSTITVSNGDIRTLNPANITWLPALYTVSFRLTCYTTRLESNYLSSPLEDHIAGLPPKDSFHSGFVNAVEWAGSGRTVGGKIIQYDSVHHRYYIPTNPNCPRTSVGACAVDGQSAAVDPTVVPRSTSSTIDILAAGIGDRKAQDGGGWINGYHIDLYFGTRLHACMLFGTNSGKQALVDYVRY